MAAGITLSMQEVGHVNAIGKPVLTRPLEYVLPNDEEEQDRLGECRNTTDLNVLTCPRSATPSVYVDL
jgi:hypothetical protein